MHKLEYPCGCTYNVFVMRTYREEKKEKPYVFTASDIYLCDTHRVPIILDKAIEMEEEAKKEYDRNLTAIQGIKYYRPKK